MSDILRESALGQLIRFVSGNRYLKYCEEEEGYKCVWDGIPALREGHTEQKKASESDSSGDFEKDRNVDKESDTAQEEHEDPVISASLTPIGPITDPLSHQRTQGSVLSRSVSRIQTRPWSVERHQVERGEELERAQSYIIQPAKTQNGEILVDWYTSDDPENPQNWSLSKKCFVMLQLILYTFVVYAASAIYTPAEEGVMRAFGVGIPKASLGLSMYVLGYGLGPLLFSPLSEIPLFGRNPPYIITFGLFVILAVPTALVRNYAGLLVLRFLTGFLGSPCLATGGATIQDMFSFIKLPYAFIAWIAATFAAPATGPVLAGFAVTAKGWRWALWEILWMAGPVFLLLFCFFPETSATNILLRKARRLRKIRGSADYKSQGEIDQGNTAIGQVIREAIVIPFKIAALDPAVLFTHLYMSLVYLVYYSFFEAFPLVYGGIYHFSLGIQGVVFTCIVAGALVGIAVYGSYVRFYLEPDIKKNGLRAQEHRLVPALFASMGLPIGLFWFAWSSREGVHWIVSVIGISCFASSAFVLVQCIFMYLPLSYPQYAASLFAANDAFRSSFACGSIIFAHPLFVNLGIGPGVSLLGGLACLGVVGVWLLWYFGATLRARSKFATG